MPYFPSSASCLTILVTSIPLGIVEERKVLLLPRPLAALLTTPWLRLSNGSTAVFHARRFRSPRNLPRRLLLRP